MLVRPPATSSTAVAKAERRRNDRGQRRARPEEWFAALVPCFIGQPPANPGPFLAKFSNPIDGNDSASCLCVVPSEDAPDRSTAAHDEMSRDRRDPADCFYTT
jgi:hypothetical protein